jgi:hypothetical protein
MSGALICHRESHVTQRRMAAWIQQHSSTGYSTPHSTNHLLNFYWFSIGPPLTWIRTLSDLLMVSVILCFAFQATQNTDGSQYIRQFLNHVRHSGINKLHYFGIDIVLLTGSLSKLGQAKFSPESGNKQWHLQIWFPIPSYSHISISFLYHSWRNIYTFFHSRKSCKWRDC